MNACLVPNILAYIQLDYMIASIIYIISTRCIGTPFGDTLTEEQQIIKKKSANQRKKIFCAGMVGGAILIYLTKPFKNCECSLLR